MTPEAPSPEPNDLGARAQADVTDLMRVLARIKRSLREHLPYWKTRPFNPKIEPFTELRNDVFRLLEYYEEPNASTLREQADESVLDLLEDEPLSRHVDSAFTVLSAYVDFRRNLDAEDLTFWQEVRQSKEALADVCKALALIQSAFDE
jgi:hypothetical protein